MANTKVQSEQIEDGSITADKIADGAIVATELADNAVTTAKINADAVTGAKIADDAIDSEHYTDGSIDTAHLADAQITVAKMAANSVDSDQYVDGSIDTVHLGDLQVTTAKIANGNISTAKIADNAVTSAKIDTNIDIAGTFDVTGATTLDAGLTVDTTTLVVDATNNRVGIGTASPTQLLHLANSSSASDNASMRIVSGTSGLARIMLGDTGYGSRGRIVYDNSDDSLQLWGADSTTSAERMRINSSGDIFAKTADARIGSDIGSVEYGTSTSNSVRFYSADTERMRITSAGNVGIGTSSPDSKLDIESNHSQLRLTDSDDSKFVLFSYSGGKLIVRNNSTDTLDNIYTLTEDGNYGIGTHSPSEKLHIATSSGDCTVLIEAEENSSSREPHLQLKGTNTSSNPIIEFGDSAGFPGTIEYENSDNSFRFGTNAGERMRILSNGKVAFSANGIGNVSSVPRDFAFYTEGATNGVEIRSNDYRLCMIGANGSGGTAVDDGYVAIASAGTTKITLSANGVSSFGNGNVEVTSGNLYISGEGQSMAGGSHNGFVIDDNGQTISSRAATNNQTHHSYYNPNGVVGTTKTNGSGTTFNTTSDYRLKENVVTDWDGTTLLKQLKPSKFNFKSDKDTVVQGFLAHEVSSIVPLAVTGEKDAVYTAEEAANDIFAVEGEPNYQQIDHSKLVPLLVKTIQELEARIEALES